MRVALLHVLGTAQKHVEVKVNLLLSVWLFVRVWNPGVVFCVAISIMILLTNQLVACTLLKSHFLDCLRLLGNPAK